MNQELPIIESQADIDKLFPEKYGWGNGKQVRVIGQYQQANASKAASRNPTLPPLHVGMVHIILDDSAILLYQFGHASGIRPADEIAQFEHQRVVVVGKFVPRAGPYYENQQGLYQVRLISYDSGIYAKIGKPAFPLLPAPCPPATLMISL